MNDRNADDLRLAEDMARSRHERDIALDLIRTRRRAEFLSDMLCLAITAAALLAFAAAYLLVRGG